MTQEIQYLHLLAGLVRCQLCGTEMTATETAEGSSLAPDRMRKHSLSVGMCCACRIELTTIFRTA